MIETKDLEEFVRCTEDVLADVNDEGWNKEYRAEIIKRLRKYDKLLKENEK